MLELRPVLPGIQTGNTIMTMEVHKLDQQHSIFSQFMAEIRDVDVQKDSMRFRRNPERVGELMACEINACQDDDMGGRRG
jgi:hypothetical protein